MRKILWMLMILCFVAAFFQDYSVSASNLKHRRFSDSFGVHLVESENITVEAKRLTGWLFDRNVGDGVVKGFFIVVKGRSTAWLHIMFFKIVVPGQVALDLFCKNLSIVVRDSFGEVYYNVVVDKEYSSLFVNNWFHLLKIMKSSYGDFFRVEIKIFGEYK